MDTLAHILHIVLPLLGIILLFLGLKKQRPNYIIGALWLSLIALLIHYQAAGGEILGSYFDYKNATIYSINLCILISTLIYLFFKLPMLQKKSIRCFTGLISAFLIVGAAILLINLWVNAYFIENRREGTPIMQVASFAPLQYCNYRYVFYKVGADDRISYLCPNHYGILPSIGYLDVSPEFLLNHLTRHAKQNKHSTQ